jgi:hypothetical protein
MPDITMCVNESCKKRFVCYRFMAEPDRVQSYALFKPGENGICEYFLNILDYPGEIENV